MTVSAFSGCFCAALSAVDAEVDPVDSDGAAEVVGPVGVFGFAGPPEGRTARRGRDRRGPGLAVSAVVEVWVLDSHSEPEFGFRRCGAGSADSAAEWGDAWAWVLAACWDAIVAGEGACGDRGEGPGVLFINLSLVSRNSCGGTGRAGLFRCLIRFSGN